MRIYFLLISTLFAIACNKKAAVATDTNITPAKEERIKWVSDSYVIPNFINPEKDIDTLLSFRRGACFGFCPVYEYMFFKGGLVRYNGIQNTELHGIYYGTLSEESWAKIYNQIQTCDFFNLAKRYPTNDTMFIQDLPSTFVFVKLGDKRHLIQDNHSPPKELKNLELILETEFLKIKLEPAIGK